MIDIADILMLACILLILIALLLVCAVAAALRLRGARIVRRGAARASSPAAVADDPFFYPFGEMPTVPRERLMVARDFRAWGIPSRSVSAAVAHRRNESDENGGRPALSGTAVVLTFPKPITWRDRVVMPGEGS